jgi:hypothetical protein
LSKPPSPDRDYGKSWKDRLEAARQRAAQPSAPLSDEELAELHDAMTSIDVSSPLDSALFWSGKDVLTAIPLDESAGGALWWDKLAPLDAKVFRDLGLAVSVEDTPGGRYLVNLGKEQSPTGQGSVVFQTAWEVVSARFAETVRGRVEILALGAWEDGVFRNVEWGALLRNPNVTCINGLDRALLPRSEEHAFFLIRRWDIERNRRYVEFLNNAPDATPRECATALDDLRETQLFYEQDFFNQLGKDRQLPSLPSAVLAAPDRTSEAGAWKYSRAWREFVQREEPS